MGKRKGRGGILSGILVFAGLTAASAWLLKSDVWVFWTWELLSVILGLIGMPVVGRLFRMFDDRGWIFSKALMIAVAGLLEWFLVTTKVIPFTTATSVGVVAILAVASFLLFLWQNKKGIDAFPESGQGGLVLWEEIVFFAAFLIWTYLAGFNAAAYGTEKFMDYGFMAAMMRSTSLPARDLWYSEGVINYYYGGQYFAVFLTKLSLSRVELTYNLMRTFVAGFACALPFSLVRQMMADRLRRNRQVLTGFSKAVPALAGLTAGVGVTFCGNLHYLVYRIIQPIVQKLTGKEVTGYWFPDATRYIGFNPDVVDDKTIHEFPCYSFILGDLHAHVVDILFVLSLLGLLYAWLCTMKREEEAFSEEMIKAAMASEEVPSLYVLTGNRIREGLLNPYIILAGILIGLFKLNNYWDFVIYMVVATGTGLFRNLVQMRGKGKAVVGLTILQALELFFISYLVSIPFSVRFETMVDGVALAKHHTMPHQLLVLWGLPFFLGLIFFITQVTENVPKLTGKKSLGRLMFQMGDSELFAILLFFCAFGLVLIPELVYVRDIYEAGNARANTMFKLTYQAFMMFACMMGYVIWHFLMVSRKVWLKIAGWVGILLLTVTLGYFGNCVNAWYGAWRQPENRAGLDATRFLEGEFIEDLGAINWLKDSIKGQPVTLEANGDSYTGYDRVSAMTGLPTILGWYVHEWLWRSNPGDLTEKVEDVKSIYTSNDPVLVERLLKVYDVTYIFIGAKEREKFGEELNPGVLSTLTNVVYSDGYGTQILRVTWQ